MMRKMESSQNDGDNTVMVVEMMDNDKGNGGKVVWNDDHGEVIQ